MQLFDRFILFVTILIPYQIFFPAYGDKYLPLYSIALLIGFVWLVVMQARQHVLLSSLRPACDTTVTFYLVFLASCYAAYFYSGDKQDALKHVFFLSVVVAGYLQYRFSSERLSQEKVLKYYLVASAPLAVLVLGVYVFKQYQYEILKFPLMKLFINPNTLAQMLVDQYSSNVLEAGRAGGVFVNAQEGALYAGFNIVAAVWLWFRQERYRYLGLAALWLATLFAFGSMSGIIACTVTAIAGFILLIGRSRRFWLALTALLIVIIAGAYITPRIHPRLIKYKTIDVTFNGRTKIWHASMYVIKNHWLSGVGLDAKTWNKAYNPYAKKTGAIRNVPPHNVFLFAWGKAGIIAFLALIGFFFFAIARHAILFLKTGDSYMLLVTLVFVWFGIECMTENFLIMDPRLAGSLWMVLGLRKL